MVCLNFDSIVISFAKKNSEATKHKSINFFTEISSNYGEIENAHSGESCLTCVFYGGYRVGRAKNRLFVEANNDRAAFILARPSRTSFSLYFRGEVSYKLSVFCGIRSCRVQSPIRFNVYSRNLWISCSMFPCLKDVYVSLDISPTLKEKFVLVFAIV